MSEPHATSTEATRRTTLGLPLTAILGLALLAAPRVPLHDLGIIEEGTFVNALFVFVPPLVWVAVAVIKQVPNPLLTLLAVGACYGILLALGHQLLWTESFGDDPPRLGGNLSGLDPTVESVIIRSFAAVSSVFTGLIVGAISGLVAWGVSGLRRRL
ncbi:hypothetical protein J2S40_003992 [Nocardioides luteus]|nr:hypothetical protein [Nocardioides luteus]MDR7312934.1 hypothetical protein [Nocardioides luteus]